MPFEKGVSGNPDGRTKGSKNKINEELREKISNFLSDNFHKVVEDFNIMKPGYRTRLYVDLLQFSLPKLQNTSNKINFEEMPEEMLDKIIDDLKKSA